MPASRDVQTDGPSVFQMSVAEADLAAEEEDQRADLILVSRPADSASATAAIATITVPEPVGCPADQCPWCGFKDHTRKSKKSCPQHPDYVGTRYPKGSKVSAEWPSGTRASHLRKPTVPLTPFSVRSAPTHKDFTAKEWVQGTGALTGHQPQACLVGEATVPKACHGWTRHTPPIELFNHFYKVNA